MSFVAFQPFQIEEVRARLRKLSDANLLRFGRAAASLCRPDGNFGHPPRRVFVEQLEEAREEWRRRHSTQTTVDCTIGGNVTKERDSHSTWLG